MAFRWLEDAARSPPGLELLSEDGCRFSGIFVIVQNRPIYQFAVRHGPSERRARHYDHRRHGDLFRGYPDMDDQGPYGR